MNKQVVSRDLLECFFLKEDDLEAGLETQVREFR